MVPLSLAAGGIYFRKPEAPTTAFSPGASVKRSSNNAAHASQFLNWRKLKI